MGTEQVGASFGITPALVGFLKVQEGWVPHRYICPAGYPTIGWGHRVPPPNVERITKKEGEALLRQDILGARGAVIALCPNIVGEPDARCAALIDFVFNLGASRLRSSTLRKRVLEEDWEEAAKEMRRWVYAAGRVFRPLVRRRAVAAGWLEHGE